MSLRICSESGCPYFPEVWMPLAEKQIERDAYCRIHAEARGLAVLPDEDVAINKPMSLEEKGEAIILRIFGNEPVAPSFEPEPAYYTDLNGNRKETPF